MHSKIAAVILLLCLTFQLQAQTTLEDDFEGNGTITTWYGDDCGINTSFNNPFQQGINTSANVMEYNDAGGTYANVRLETGLAMDLSTDYTFSLKIYIPSNGITGNQTNQISLKLQDGFSSTPWTTQCEIIKPVLLDQWQTITFDFANDNYINLNAGSLPPTQRDDFNRIVIQINGENNLDHVIAYIDDFLYDGVISTGGNSDFDYLVWSDEFDGNGALDNTKWFHQTQLPAGGSWFNDELQHYTNRLENSFLENGILKIVAKKESFTDQGHTKSYTSARLNSKFAFQYGRVEVRAKMPFGVGTWPAIWMLGKNINEDGAYWDNEGYGTTYWPACGEIDIIEHWGSNQNYAQSALHTPSSHGATINHGGRFISDVSTAFHVYAVEWTDEKMIFSIDNTAHYIYEPIIKDAATWPFDAEQYILLNFAIAQDIDPAFTNSTFEIDYVRVYQKNNVSVPTIDFDKNLSTFPNPFQDELRIKTNSNSSSTIAVNIFSIDGRKVASRNTSINNGLITIKDLAELTNGIYFVQFTLDSELQTVKVIKED